MDVDMLSPLAFLVAGVLGICFRAWLRAWRAARGEVAAENLRLIERFEARSRASWALIVVGVLWLAQISLERRLGGVGDPDSARATAHNIR
jgi:hypothetical protein